MKLCNGPYNCSNNGQIWFPHWDPSANEDVYVCYPCARNIADCYKQANAPYDWENESQSSNMVLVHAQTKANKKQLVVLEAASSIIRSCVISSWKPMDFCR